MDIIYRRGEKGKRKISLSLLDNREEEELRVYFHTTGLRPLVLFLCTREYVTVPRIGGSVAILESPGPQRGPPRGPRVDSWAITIPAVSPRGDPRMAIIPELELQHT